MFEVNGITYTLEDTHPEDPARGAHVTCSGPGVAFTLWQNGELAGMWHDDEAKAVAQVILDTGAPPPG